MHALIESVTADVSPETASLTAEMVDANESHIALDMLSEMLAGSGAQVSDEVVDEFAELASQLRLGPETSARLRP
jgi:hypothetical protein